jgi:hypothetical protein
MLANAVKLENADVYSTGGADKKLPYQRSETIGESQYVL